MEFGGPITVKTAATLLLALATSAAAENLPLLWKDPGPIETLDLRNGPAPAAYAPAPPFTFVKEETEGINPKVVLTDSRGRKWMVKFGDEAKPETFGSRIAWAAGFPVRANYYLASGRIAGATSLKRAQTYIQPDGTFREARFQRFDDESFHQVPGGKLDISQKHPDTLHLNGLKLVALLLGNWDVKPANSAVFEIAGQRYATLSDWGAALGDGGSPTPAERKWNCPAYSRVTETLIESVENGFVSFNYMQYAGRGVDSLPRGIRVEDMKWLVGRLGKLSDQQIHSALLASGASSQEAACFTDAIRKRLNVFAAAANPTEEPGVIRSRTVTRKTTITRPSTETEVK